LGHSVFGGIRGPSWLAHAQTGIFAWHIQYANQYSAQSAAVSFDRPGSMTACMPADSSRTSSRTGRGFVFIVSSLSRASSRTRTLSGAPMETSTMRHRTARRTILQAFGNGEPTGARSVLRPRAAPAACQSKRRNTTDAFARGPSPDPRRNGHREVHPCIETRARTGQGGFPGTPATRGRSVPCRCGPRNRWRPRQGSIARRALGMSLRRRRATGAGRARPGGSWWGRSRQNLPILDRAHEAIVLRYHVYLGSVAPNASGQRPRTPNY
jgi:hypothetical protein